LSSTYAVIAGGYSNTVKNSVAAGIAGGQENFVAYGYAAVILGGETNKVGAYFYAEEILETEPGAYCTIIGGNANTVYGNYHTLGGGLLNTVSSTVKNKRSTDSSGSTLYGGAYNTAQGIGSSLTGGYYNMATGQKFSTVVGGYINTARSSYSTVVGGSRNKAYSNFATIVGGYMNKANSKFASIPGGSRNTINGRYGVALGAKTTLTTEQSAVFNFRGDDCSAPDDNSVAICTDSMQVNGEEVLDLFSRRRELEDQAELTKKSFDGLEKSVNAMEAEFVDRQVQIDALTKQLQSYEEMRAKHEALKQTVSQVKSLLSSRV